MKDVRGIDRGACTQCPCTEFQAANDGKVSCSACNHAPVQHKSRSRPVAPPSSLKKLSTPRLTSLPYRIVRSPPRFISAPALPRQSATMTSLCAHTGCQEETWFDPNTGWESAFCSDHDRGYESDEATISQIPECSLAGCHRPRYVDESGVMFDCCSRSHGRQYLLQQQPMLNNPDIPLEMRCKNPSCSRPRYSNGDGQYFDFCGKSCRDSFRRNPPPPGTSLSIAPPPPPAGDICALPGCQLGVHSGHLFCSKGHGQQAKMIVLQELNRQSSEYQKIHTHFKQQWHRNKGHVPNPDAVFKVFSPALDKQFQQYKSSLSNSTVEEHYHGTSLLCDLLSRGQACENSKCGVCGISRNGFNPSLIGTNISRFKRFGSGFYLAPNSSKCHDYTRGVSTHRAMLLCDVLPGNKYQLQQDNTGLNSPPQGYDSVYGQHGGSLNYDEIVLFKTEALLPKYVIVYQKDGVGKIAQ